MIIFKPIKVDVVLTEGKVKNQNDTWLSTWTIISVEKEFFFFFFFSFFFEKKKIILII